MKQFFLPAWLCCFLYLFLFANKQVCLAQAPTKTDAIGNLILNPAQQRAMEIFNKADTVSVSPLWPHVIPALFFANVRKNILYPEKLDQGKATNFCSYAALTLVIIEYQPETYVRTILSLYRTGEAALHKKTIVPSERVRNVAGTLKHKGDLEVLHADQLWFLSLADNFKGYLNMFNRKYNDGDEDTFWSATNYGKFNRMLKKMGNYRLEAVGSDLLRPPSDDMYGYISHQLDRGIVLLYINSKLLHPNRHFFFKIPAPTHFVVLYEIYKTDDVIELKYWDYGLKTELVMTEKRLQKMVYGITKINNR